MNISKYYKIYFQDLLEDVDLNSWERWLRRFYPRQFNRTIS